MGLAVGVAIASLTEAAQISHEALLTNVDDPADTAATVSNALAEATNELIRRIRSRGLDPALVDAATIVDLKAAAVFYALYSVFSSMEQDDVIAKRAESYKARFEEQLIHVVIRTTNAGALTSNPLGTPVVRNVNSTWVVGGRDIKIPGGTTDQTWTQKL